MYIYAYIYLCVVKWVTEMIQGMGEIYWEYFAIIRHLYYLRCNIVLLEGGLGLVENSWTNTKKNKEQSIAEMLKKRKWNHIKCPNKAVNGRKSRKKGKRTRPMNGKQ